MIKQTIEQILSNTRLFDRIFNILFQGSTYQSRSILGLSCLNRTKNSNTASEKDRKHFKNFELGRPWTGRPAVQVMCRLLVQTGMSWTIFGGQHSDEIICLFPWNIESICISKLESEIILERLLVKNYFPEKFRTECIPTRSAYRCPIDQTWARAGYGRSIIIWSVELEL